MTYKVKGYGISNRPEWFMEFETENLKMAKDYATKANEEARMFVTSVKNFISDIRSFKAVIETV